MKKIFATTLIAGLAISGAAFAQQQSGPSAGSAGTSSMSGAGMKDGMKTRPMTTGTTNQAPASSANSGVDRPSNSGGPAVGAAGVTPQTNNRSDAVRR